MDRVASWYKKHTQRAVVVIAVVVATGVNADTLQMAARLSTNETVRKATADDCGDHAVLPRSTLRPTLSVLVEAYGNQGLPLEWDSGAVPAPSLDSAYAGFWASKLFGLFLTTIATAPGSSLVRRAQEGIPDPFWELLTAGGVRLALRA